MNKDNRQKPILSAALLVAVTASALAQGNGIADANEAISTMNLCSNPDTKLVCAIGAVVGLIESVRIYGKFLPGNLDTPKTTTNWFEACIFLIIAVTILRSFSL